MLLPEPADMYTLLLRTDYSDDLAWHAAVNAATAVHDADDFDRFGASLSYRQDLWIGVSRDLLIAS